MNIKCLLHFSGFSAQINPFFLEICAGVHMPIIVKCPLFAYDLNGGSDVFTILSKYVRFEVFTAVTMKNGVF
jgi:hypothetical protein